MKPFKINGDFRLEIDPNRGWRTKLIYLIMKDPKGGRDCYFWISGRQVRSLKQWVLKADKELDRLRKPKNKP